ncbi:MAG: hypothetical protein GC168_15290 [Candidatus Hydrogenedens sp.]|nr:hypothetical protein [Candidatus Hydrogenedens sp.]
MRLICLCLAVLCAAAHAEEHLWKPAVDAVYLQEIGHQIPTDAPIDALAAINGTMYAVQAGALYTVGETALTPVAGAPSGIRVWKEAGGALWAAADGGVYRFDGQAWTNVSDLAMIDFRVHRGVVHAATRDRLYRFEDGAFVDIEPADGWLTTDTTNVMEDGTQVLPNPVRLGPIAHFASYLDTLYVLSPSGQLALIEDRLFNEYSIDWGAFPSDVIHDLVPYGSGLYFPTGKGLSVLRGMALTTWTGAEGLPSEATTCVAPGFDGDLWIGTTTGAIRRTREGEWQYFGAHHWLPGDGVRAIATAGQTVYVGTDAGLGVLRYEPYTLRKKADHFEQQLAMRGHLRMGFIHKLWWSDEYKQWIREISDNDGGNTAQYLSAMSYKYAATGDRAARDAAVDAFTAMVWLEKIAPSRGFFARAVWNDEGDLGQRSTGGSGGLPAKWYQTDDGEWWWKGDTSSDEVNAHYGAVSLFYELAAKGDEKTRAMQHLARITDHIVENGWILRDMDGGPTRWGRWNPEYLQRPYGFESRGLNGMEAQCYVWTAYGMTGDAKYKDALSQLLEWNYHRSTVREKYTFPPESVVTWDDELAFRAFQPLLRYTDDPDLRAIYLRALARHWEALRMQKIPFFNYLYGAMTGNDCETEQAAKHLRDWNLDTVNYDYRNMHRDDLRYPEPGYTPYASGTRGLSPRETTAMWGSRTALEYNGGGGGGSITPAIGWLEDYWMGRYYGFITEPQTKDHKLLEAEIPAGSLEGAAAYAGPERPEGILELVD